MIDTLSIRNNIIRLGFSGKLTSQMDSDDKVSDMLSRINPKKNIVQTEKTPYEIPQTWAWVRLSDLYSINPKVEASESDEAAFISMEKISPGFSDNFTYEVQSWEKASKNHTKFIDGDVAFAKISPCFENRKSFIAKKLPNGIGGGTTELIILRQLEMHPEYTYYVVLDQRFINTGAASYKGTVGQQRVHSEVIKNYLVPVPPLAEQKRIVKKVTEAFAILDKIDALQDQYASNQEALKSKLIDAAIQGKLTKQFEKDGTAENLYQRIQIEKNALVKKRIIKRPKPLSEISDEEIPFGIPENWIWARWGNLSNQIQYGYNAPAQSSGRIKMVRITDIQDNKVDWGSVPFCEIEEEKILNYLLHSNDILFARTGATVGKSYLVESVAEDAVFAGYLIRTSFSNLLNAKYLRLFMESRLYWKQLTNGTTATAQPNCNAQTLSKMIVPLPPLAEQERIAATMDLVLGTINGIV